VACQALYYFLLGPRIPAALYLTEATLDHASHLRFHPTNFINFKQQLFLQVSRSQTEEREADLLELALQFATPVCFSGSSRAASSMQYRFLHAVP
jgi:hypothetical protein